MIYKNELDRESYIRCKNIDDLKRNTFLVIGDLVKLIDDVDFYEITNEESEIQLDNGLFAKKIFIEILDLKTVKKTIIEAINELHDKSFDLNTQMIINDDGNLILTNHKGELDLGRVVGYNGVNATIESIKANIDNKVGDPEVEIIDDGNLVNKNIIINFKNLNGQTGESTTIRSITAEAESIDGPPEVVITTNGTEIERDYHLVFKLQKGKDAFNEEGKIEYPNGTTEWIE